jgi:hypothetical protein
VENNMSMGVVNKYREETMKKLAFYQVESSNMVAADYERKSFYAKAKAIEEVLMDVFGMDTETLELDRNMPRLRREVVQERYPEGL